MANGPYIAPLLIGSAWRTVAYFVKWMTVTIGVLVGSTLFAGIYYFRIHEATQQTASAIMAPVFIIATFLTMLLYRSEAVLLAQGFGWRLRRIFLTYGLWLFVYLTILHLASVIGWLMLVATMAAVILGILSYPSLKAGVSDITGTLGRYAFVIVAFALLGGANPADAARNQATRNALRWMPNSSIVRPARPSEEYRKRQMARDVKVTQTIS